MPDNPRTAGHIGLQPRETSADVVLIPSAAGRDEADQRRGALSVRVRRVADVLFPKRCPVCGTCGAAPCATCARALRRVDGEIVVPGVASCRAAFVYDEAARPLLLALKYRNRRDAMAFLAAELTALIDVPADVVTWVPTTTARRRARGFDQAELLARAVGRRSGLPARPLLRRLDGRPQTGRDQSGRREGPSFSVRSRRPRPASVLLIDDIGTTGATLQAAARALRRADGPVVHARTVAWTPKLIRSDRGHHPPK